MGPWASPPVSSPSPPSPSRCSRPGRSARSSTATPTRGVITIIDDVEDADDITVQRPRRRAIVITRVGGGLTTPQQHDCTSSSPDGFDCPAGSSFAVDLGPGNDRFEALDVDVPISVAGGDGNDEMRPATAPTSSPAAPATTPWRQPRDRRLLRRGRRRPDRGARRARGAHLLRRRQRRGAQRLRRHHRRVRARDRRDLDGFSTAVDCNDNAFNIKPGAAEVFDNGIDENCDGRDNPNLDRDADGFPQPATATTTTRRSSPARSRSAATRSTRTATGARSRSPSSAPSSRTSGCHAHARAAALARRPPRAQGRPHRPHLQGQGLPQEADASGGPSRATSSASCCSARSGARACASARGYAHDHRGGHDRAHVLLRGQARRAAAADDHLPRAGRVEGALVLRLSRAPRLRRAPPPRDRVGGHVRRLGHDDRLRRRGRHRSDRRLRHRHHHPLHPLRRRRPGPRPAVRA